MKNNINKLNNILKKYHTIIIFILFVISLMLVSILNEESYINFLSFNNNNNMEKIIKEEQDICSKKNVCGYVDGRNIPCPPTSCNDTCICRTK